MDQGELLEFNDLIYFGININQG